MLSKSHSADRGHLLAGPSHGYMTLLPWLRVHCVVPSGLKVP